MSKENELCKTVQNFFLSYLPNERVLSPHTISAYRDTMKLYLHSVTSNSKNKNLALDDLNAQSVLDLMDNLKRSRGNSIKTQNQRLAALKSFFQYLRVQSPLYQFRVNYFVWIHRFIKYRRNCIKIGHI